DGYKTGDEVVYHNGSGTSIGGLTDGQHYYVIVADATTIKLASTYANAVAEIPVPIQLSSTGDSPGQTISPVNDDGRITFNPTDDSVKDKQIALAFAHGFTTGEEVVYHNGGGTNTNIQGLNDGHTYYVVVIDSNTFELADTHAHAVASSPTVLS